MNNSAETPTPTIMPTAEPTIALPALEQYRPAFHFTPATAWMNDPNGLVYYDGEYHLFYQHNPDDTVWGPMHWGHAVSPDLINWQHLPIALYPDELGTIFSGSAVIDWHNTAGFGKEAMVAIFTHDKQPHQMQSIAWSNDKGRTWTKYAGNPVIAPPSDMPDFRDPKVSWYGDRETGHWTMCLAAGQRILFYKSADLKTWKASGSFGLNEGHHGGVWECPDLFELPVEGTDKTRWVLLVSTGDNAPAKGSGQQYFIGRFDGETFTNENDKETVLWADYGADFYAGQSWSDMTDGRRVWIGWMNNWQYANTIPTSTWRSAMTLPREVGLAQTADGIRMVQKPVDEFTRLRGALQSWDNVVIDGESDLLARVDAETVELIATFEVEPTADRFGLRVRVGSGQHTTIGYCNKQKALFVERGESGDTSFDDAFSTAHSAPLEPQNGLIKLHIIVDRSSVELFANDGLVSMTERVFSAENATGLSLFSEGSNVILQQLDLYKLSWAVPSNE